MFGIITSFRIQGLRHHRGPIIPADTKGLRLQKWLTSRKGITGFHPTPKPVNFRTHHGIP